MKLIGLFVAGLVVGISCKSPSLAPEPTGSSLTSITTKAPDPEGYQVKGGAWQFSLAPKGQDEGSVVDHDGKKAEVDQVKLSKDKAISVRVKIGHTYRFKMEGDIRKGNKGEFIAVGTANCKGKAFVDGWQETKIDKKNQTVAIKVCGKKGNVVDEVKTTPEDQGEFGDINVEADVDLDEDTTESQESNKPSKPSNEEKTPSQSLVSKETPICIYPEKNFKGKYSHESDSKKDAVYCVGENQTEALRFSLPTSPYKISGNVGSIKLFQGWSTKAFIKKDGKVTEKIFTGEMADFGSKNIEKLEVWKTN